MFMTIYVPVEVCLSFFGLLYNILLFWNTSVLPVHNLRKLKNILIVDPHSFVMFGSRCWICIVCYIDPIMLEDELWMRWCEKKSPNWESRSLKAELPETELLVFESWSQFSSVFRKHFRQVPHTPKSILITGTQSELLIFYCCWYSQAVVVVCVDVSSSTRSTVTSEHLGGARR